MNDNLVLEKQECKKFFKEIWDIIFLFKLSETAAKNDKKEHYNKGECKNLCKKEYEFLKIIHFIKGWMNEEEEVQKVLLLKFYSIIYEKFLTETFDTFNKKFVQTNKSKKYTFSDTYDNNAHVIIKSNIARLRWDFRNSRAIFRTIVFNDNSKRNDAIKNFVSLENMEEIQQLKSFFPDSFSTKIPETSFQIFMNIGTHRNNYVHGYNINLKQQQFIDLFERFLELQSILSILKK